MPFAREMLKWKKKEAWETGKTKCSWSIEWEFTSLNIILARLLSKKIRKTLRKKQGQRKECKPETGWGEPRKKLEQITESKKEKIRKTNVFLFLPGLHYKGIANGTRALPV